MLKEEPAKAEEKQTLNTIGQTLKVDIDSKTEQIFDRQYQRRPQVLSGATYKFNTPLGVAYITINDLNGFPSEIFLNVGKAGSDVFAMSEALGRVCSLFLRYGEHGQKERLLIKHLKGIGGSGAIGFGANRVESIADALAKALEYHIDQREQQAKASETSSSSATTTSSSSASASTTPAVSASSVTADEATATSTRSPNGSGGAESTLDLCPSCGSASLVNSEGCKNCTNCGYSRCS